jgi:hypothetical protein
MAREDVAKRWRDAVKRISTARYFKRGLGMDTEPIGTYEGEGLVISVYQDGRIWIRCKAQCVDLSVQAEQWRTIEGFVRFVMERVR